MGQPSLNLIMMLSVPKSVWRCPLIRITDYLSKGNIWTIFLRSLEIAKYEFDSFTIRTHFRPGIRKFCVCIKFID